MEAIAESVNLIYNDKVVLTKNDLAKMTYFSFPTKEDVLQFNRNGKKFF